MSYTQLRAAIRECPLITEETKALLLESLRGLRGRYSQYDSPPAGGERFATLPGSARVLDWAKDPIAAHQGAIQSDFHRRRGAFKGLPDDEALRLLDDCEVCPGFVPAVPI